MHKMLQQVFGSNFKPFAPKCYYAHYGSPASVLVFEDLKTEGFRLADRNLGLEMQHTLLCVRTLATYHAASVVLYKKGEDNFEPFNCGVYGKNNTKDLETMFVPVLRDLAVEVGTWPGYERFSGKLHEIADNCTKMMLDGVTRDDNEFNVLAHEDAWINNLMYRYSEDTGEVVDLRLVDFQTCQWISPAIDLQRYLLSSASAEVVQQYEFVLEEYLKVLRDTLKALGHEHLCPTIDHLKQQMKKRAMFGLILGIIVRSVILADSEDFPDVDKIMRNEGKVKFSKLFLEVIRKQLPVLEKNDWI
ncbi:hypothetical protein L9F63_022897 [Diploptera punctata]|uniref:CHK kinase-like domain-containing protein n=1 Tax=Diploptera punctata TaxID=6984 RepID=A0AAD7ZME2_DIPPU|nr:hypothetical protein L9F63_022897 [Diploptera punctata]